MENIVDQIVESDEETSSFVPEPKDDSGKFDPQVYKFLNSFIMKELKKGDPSGPDDYRKGPFLFSVQTFAIVSRLDSIVKLLSDIKKSGISGGQQKESGDEKKMKKNRKEAMDTLKMFGSIGLLVAGFAAFVFVTGLAGQITSGQILNAMGVIGLFYLTVVPMVALAAILSPFAPAFIPFAIAVALISASLILFAYGIKKFTEIADPKMISQFTESIVILAKGLAVNIGWILLGAISAALLAVFGVGMLVATATILVATLAIIGFSKLWTKDGSKAFTTMTNLPLRIADKIGYYILGAVAAALFAVFGCEFAYGVIAITIATAALIAFNFLYEQAGGEENALKPMNSLLTQLANQDFMKNLALSLASAALLYVLGGFMLVATLCLAGAAAAILLIGVIAANENFLRGLGGIATLANFGAGEDMTETVTGGDGNELYKIGGKLPGWKALATAIGKYGLLAVMGVELLVAAVSIAAASAAMGQINPANIGKFIGVLGSDEIESSILGLANKMKTGDLKSAAKQMAFFSAFSAALMTSSLFLVVAFKALNTIVAMFTKKGSFKEDGKTLEMSQIMMPFFEVANFAKDDRIQKLKKKDLDAFVEVSKDFSTSSTYLWAGFKVLNNIDESTVNRFRSTMDALLTSFSEINELCKGDAVSTFSENVKNIANAAKAVADIEEALKMIPESSNGLSEGVTKFKNYLNNNLKTMVGFAEDTAAQWKKLSKDSLDTSSQLKAMSQILTPLADVATATKTILNTATTLGSDPEGNFKKFYQVLLGRDGIAGAVADWFVGDYSILGLIKNVLKVFNLKNGIFVKSLQKAGIEVTSVDEIVNQTKGIMKKFEDVISGVGDLATQVATTGAVCAAANFEDENDPQIKAITNFVNTIMPTLARGLSSMDSIDTPKNLGDITKFVDSVVHLSNVPPQAQSAITAYGNAVSNMVSAFNSKGLAGAGESIQKVFDVDVNRLNYLGQMINLLRLQNETKAEFDGFSKSMDQIAESISNVNKQVEKANVEGLEKFIGNLQKIQETGPITVTLEIADTQSQIQSIAENTSKINQTLSEMKQFFADNWPKYQRQDTKGTEVPLSQPY